jgi:patatin-like phospholipase/acyl hydrolase
MAFKILTIDGGGIRGIFPAMFLASVEAELKRRGIKHPIHGHFDLIAGTSTGGIIALALALGMPAHDMYKLYLNNAGTIFGNGQPLFFGQFRRSKYDRDALEDLVREEFRKLNNGVDPLLRDVKTNVCIPIYDLMQGKPSVLKNAYHPAFKRDYHIHAYQVAMATSAAPTYFDPYSTQYIDLHGMDQQFTNKVDGGVVANNPSLVAIVEAQKAFGQELKDLKVLSIGTGHRKFVDGCSRSSWGLWYWAVRKRRLFDLFLQGQSQLTQNLISLLQKGIDKGEPDNFLYTRVDTELDETCMIEMDDSDPEKLRKLAEKATHAFQNEGTRILNDFFQP